jgi:hypothetical protein
MGCNFIKDEIMNPVIDFFDGDLGKVADWINTKNPMLGGLSPSDMILQGRQDKLQLFIEKSIQRNRPNDA